MSSSTALLIIDVQLGLFDGAQPVYDGLALIGRINTLAQRARRAGVPIVFIQDHDVGAPDSSAWQLHPALDAQPADLYIRKPYSDSFYQTALQAALAERDVTHLVIAGCKTDACVDATSRRALSLGYDVTLVSDGHSTTDNSFLSAAQSIAYYNIILDGLGLEDGFGNGQHSITVCPAQDVLLGAPA
jgi:nicotinamidase-related amidase